MNDDRGFFETLVTGPNLLVLTALTLMGCGAFALFQAATGKFLPHDVDFLGLTAQQLCSLRGCRVVHFMVFVPTDLEFMGITPGELQAFNAHLVPLIAHDR